MGNDLDRSIGLRSRIVGLVHVVMKILENILPLEWEKAGRKYDFRGLWPLGRDFNIFFFLRRQFQLN